MKLVRNREGQFAMSRQLSVTLISHTQQLSLLDKTISGFDGVGLCC